MGRPTLDTCPTCYMTHMNMTRNGASGQVKNMNMGVRLLGCLVFFVGLAAGTAGSAGPWQEKLLLQVDRKVGSASNLQLHKALGRCLVFQVPGGAFVSCGFGRFAAVCCGLLFGYLLRALISLLIDHCCIVFVVVLLQGLASAVARRSVHFSKLLQPTKSVPAAPGPRPSPAAPAICAGHRRRGAMM